MTHPGEPPYSGPPPTGAYRMPPQLPPLPPPPYYPPYPPPGAGTDERPATALAAAVLGWVLAALLFLSAGLLFFGATFLHDLQTTGDYTGDDVAELLVDGLFDIVAAVLLIAGGVALTGRNRSGRTLLVGGAAIVLVLSLYWLIRWSGQLAGVTTGYAVIFGIGALLVAGFSVTPGVSSWLAARH